MLNRKEQICALLKGIETGDPSSVAVVNQINTFNTTHKHMRVVKAWLHCSNGCLKVIHASILFVSLKMATMSSPILNTIFLLQILDLKYLSLKATKLSSIGIIFNLDLVLILLGTRWLMDKPK